MLLTATQRKAVEQYYKDLAAYRAKKVTHETAVRSAFQNILALFSQSVGWTLIPEQTLPSGKRPDGTLRDSFNLPRGYWEAKDTKDDLATEIRKKISAGYPITNTIFEDTRRAVLYQNNRPVDEADLANEKELLRILDGFIHYTPPDIENFERAVEEFKESIPDLAQGLLERIKEEHAANKEFVAAFSTFLELCRTSLDPHMSSATVNEMLVQHLLTERLFRTVFDNPDFVTRNVIASEIEQVIQALTRRAFNRREFLKTLDRFYLAIENAARNLDDWSEKQRFLNTVYERFFQGFSTKQADTHGIVYTPQEIVDFMCSSVDVILKQEFGSSLSTPGVQILDPATGTGNFIVNLIRRINGGTLEQKYLHDLFCNEIMLLPYYIAALNIEHAYYERTRQYKPFEGIAFADTLDLAEGRQLPLFVERNTERIVREKMAPIMVVIGNPPYNVGQKSENDNNKNRKYDIIDERIRETYVKDSKATNTRVVSDAYVKFFRWATDRLGERDGIVCLVTNNGFLDGVAFDGFRKRLAEEFTSIYVVDLGGNARKQGGGNVFGIMVGVSIIILVRARKGEKAHQTKIFYHKVQDDLKRIEKLKVLSTLGNISHIEWQELQPDQRYTWLTASIHIEFDTFVAIGSKEAKAANSISSVRAEIETIFKVYSLGIQTNRDSWMYNFDSQELAKKASSMIATYNTEIDRWVGAGSPKDIDNFVINDEAKIKWSSRLKECFARKQKANFQTSSIRNALYRPFTHQYLYFDSIMTHRQGMFPQIFPTPFTETENTVICVAGLGDRKGFGCLATNIIPNLDLAFEKTQCFPYYTYAEDGSKRRENITDWALQQFQARYGVEVTKRAIFHFVYAMLHHPAYRERYAENLKHDLPRLPLLSSASAFATCVRIGKALMELHLGYEDAAQYPLTWVEQPDQPITWRVEKMKLSSSKDALQVNAWLRLEGIPQTCYSYRLGNRSALEWVIDQYQVSEDKRSGIVSDPNRADDEQYIVRLVARVITVSLETVKLVEELAAQVSADEWLQAS